MTAWAYGLEGNWDRTQVRLLSFPESEVRAWTVGVLEAAVAQGQPVDVLQRLARLASAYGADNPAVLIYAEEGTMPDSSAPEGSGMTPAAVTPSNNAAAPTPVAETPTPTAIPTPMPLPTPTPEAGVQASPFDIVTQTVACEPAPALAISLEISRTVEVRGRPTVEIVEAPQREIWLIWEDGADRAMTGFKPELGLGYVDFVLEPGRAYNLYVDSPTGLPALTIQAAPCAPQDGEGWLSRFLVLREEAPLPTPTPEATSDLTLTLTLTSTVSAAATVSATTPTQ
jgi:hypothetical protein